MIKSLAEAIAARLNECSPEDVCVECFDLRSKEQKKLTLDEETVAVLGMPVYVGKIPMPGAEAIRRIDGNGAMTLAAVSYGGRTYGNALYELSRLAEERNFKMIGAGAFMISYMAARGSARSSSPAIDIKSLSEFADAASSKTMRLGGCEIEGLKVKPAPLEVKGRMPVHKISRISPSAAAAAQEILEKINRRHKKSEWFL